MPMQITIKPSDHAFPCDADETVLQAAMRADLMIPYGCRNGACGTSAGICHFASRLRFNCRRLDCQNARYPSSQPATLCKGTGSKL